VRTTVVSGLPSSQTQAVPVPLISGVADVEFVNGMLYGLLTGAGCSHGVPSVPNQVFRVNANGTWTTVANLSAWYQANPTAVREDDDFEPDGTPYSMVAVRGDLYVVEPNHGSLDRVDIASGSIARRGHLGDAGAQRADDGVVSREFLRRQPADIPGHAGYVEDPEGDAEWRGEDVGVGVHGGAGQRVGCAWPVVRARVDDGARGSGADDGSR
jgi:hypothetical protein